MATLYLAQQTKLFARLDAPEKKKNFKFKFIIRHN